jgi:hypothetical protein
LLRRFASRNAAVITSNACPSNSSNWSAPTIGVRSVISPFKLLEADDPIYHWRERLLDAFDGLARKSPGFPV